MKESSIFCDSSAKMRPQTWTWCYVKTPHKFVKKKIGRVFEFTFFVGTFCRGTESLLTRLHHFARFSYNVTLPLGRNLHTLSRHLHEMFWFYRKINMPRFFSLFPGMVLNYSWMDEDGTMHVRFLRNKYDLFCHSLYPKEKQMEYFWQLEQTCMVKFIFASKLCEHFFLRKLTCFSRNYPRNI